MSRITTTSILPPFCRYWYDSFLLDPLLGLKIKMENKIIPLSIKKIRPQDVGKRREFDKLMEQYLEVYGRKKNEETEYKAKIEEATKKRPSFSNTGSTMRFERF